MNSRPERRPRVGILFGRGGPAPIGHPGRWWRPDPGRRMTVLSAVTEPSLRRHAEFIKDTECSFVNPGFGAILKIMDISPLQQPTNDDISASRIESRARGRRECRSYLARRVGSALLALLGAAALPGALAGAATSSAHVAPATGLVRQPASGLSLAPQFTAHSLTMPGSLTSPDDISGFIGSNFFIAYQNGVSPTGAPSPSGATNSTILEYRQDGTVVTQWSVVGKCDGLTTDPANNRVILTVNEDANSSMYIIHPSAAPGAQMVHLSYNVDPVTLGGGGTDDVVVDPSGNVFTAGSNPSAATAPALYKVGINEATGTATLTSVFADNDPALPITLTDPDSLSLVPAAIPQVGGDILLDSQGDSRLVFISHAGTPGQTLTTLPVGTQVDALAWATASTGTMLVTDAGTNKTTSISGQFTPGTLFITAPSDSGVAGFVGTVNLTTGTITPVATGFNSPHGLLFIPGTPNPGPYGYHLAAADGGVFSFGDSMFFGSMGGQRLNRPVVGMATTPDRQGYWLVASDGGIFAFGDAGFFGSTGNLALNAPVVGMTATPDGLGYWLVASDGGVFSFGDARGFGSLGGNRPAQPVVAMAATADGKGYWIVTASGSVTPFGDAETLGSVGGALNKPIVGMAATPDGRGYWLVASDGGIFTFGDAGFFGSAGNIHLDRPIVGMVPTASGNGYWLVASDGGVFSYGDAAFFGSTGGIKLNAPIVGAGA